MVRGIKKRGSEAAKRRAPTKHTEKFKKELGDRRRGIIVTAETRERLRLALRGKIATPEHKQNMLTAQRRAFDLRGPESEESCARRRAAWLLRKQKKVV